jgi:hypothetical protein
VCGTEGTVIDVLNEDGAVAVNFDKNMDGHSYHGKAAPGHGWIVAADICELIPPVHPKILITTDGTTTLARLYDGKEVIRTEKAVCAQDDTFDFATGANLAYDRLMGRSAAKVKREQSEPKPAEPVKLYCVKGNNGLLTKGKVYDISDGKLYYDNKGCGYVEEIVRDINVLKRTWLNFHLVPLVQRPAKVGEWVLLDRDDCVGINKQGSIAKVIKVRSGEVWFYDPTGIYTDGICASGDFWWHLVLDGYQPEPPKPMTIEQISEKLGYAVCIKEDGK